MLNELFLASAPSSAVSYFWYKKEIEHNNVKIGPTNSFEMENGPNHLFLKPKKYKQKVVYSGHLNIWEYPFFD